MMGTAGMVLAEFLRKGFKKILWNEMDFYIKFQKKTIVFKTPTAGFVFTAYQNMITGI